MIKKVEQNKKENIKNIEKTLGKEKANKVIADVQAKAKKDAGR